MKILTNIGRYFMMMRQVFAKPDKFRIFRKRIMVEVEAIGLGSIPIVALMSIFMGAVITLQTMANMDSPMLPVETIGFITRQSTILEFSPTIISLILAGKVGSNIASEIGTMRVTEQIDALDIMGVNSANYLILPKVIAAVFSFPVVITISMGLSLLGGWIACVQTGMVSSANYVRGLQYWFYPMDIVYGLVKTLFFAFIITSVASYHGYYTKGGALDVGRSSTKAVVYASVVLLLTNLVLTQLLLT